MSSLLTKTVVACSGCNKPLSGGRDTFGTYDSPLCSNCRFIPMDTAMQARRDRLATLRDELQAVKEQIEELKEDRNEIDWQIEIIERELGLTPGQEVAA